MPARQRRCKRQWARAILEKLDEYTADYEYGNYTLVDKKNADEPYFRGVLEYIGLGDGVIDADGDYQRQAQDGPTDALRLIQGSQSESQNQLLKRLSEFSET